MIKELKKIFRYRQLWKVQKNRNKNLKKKINKLSQGITEELKLDITNEEIRKLKFEIGRLKLEVQKANKEAQHYFDLLMEKIGNER